MKFVDLSIIIVNYNTKKFLGSCLLSLYKTIKNVTYEVIVVDNCSRDGSVEFIKKKFPKVRLIVNKTNVGYAKANNQATGKARGAFILLLNPDTVVFEKSIEKIIEYAQNNPVCGVIGCRVINPGNQLQWDSCGSFLTPFKLFLKEAGLEFFSSYHNFFDQRLLRYWPRNTSRRIDWVSGVCMLIRKETIEDIGMLDERYFAYMEDMDYCRRAINSKWDVFFIHSAPIFHNAGTSWRQRPEIHLFTSLTSERKYFGKYYGVVGVFFFKIIYIYGSFVRFFINLLTNKRHKAKDHYMTLLWLMTGKI